jgi:hypothetical protein
LSPGKFYFVQKYKKVAYPIGKIQYLAPDYKKSLVHLFVTSKDKIIEGRETDYCTSKK